MCGVFGFWSEQHKVTEKKVQDCINKIHHRGPDGDGVWISSDETLGFGHKRLAIIDLSHGADQPMKLSKSPTDEKILVYNGEVYNYKEIKDQLLKEGRTFQTHSDTEVLLHALDLWGLDVIPKLNGMWGFIYYDRKEQKVIISRDRCGMKPLYYYWDKKNLVVASEVKAILESGVVKAKLNNTALVEYFTFQNVISDQTLFDKIEMVPTGTNLIFDLKTKDLKFDRYWDFHFQNNTVKTEEELIDELDSMFNSAIERHLIGDVEIGATISGGLDSSSIVSFVTQRNAKLKTFTGYFDTSKNDSADRSYSEQNDARMIADFYKTDHHELQIFPHDLTDTIEKIVWHQEDPKVGMSYTFYRILQMVSSKVKVSLSGSGGDEIFAGYPWRYERVSHINDPTVFNDELFNCWSRVIPYDKQAGAFTRLVKNKTSGFNPFDSFKKIIDQAKDDTPLNKALYFEAKTFLHGMLMVEDKLGMASSIETRLPLLDSDFIDFAMRIPDYLKYKDGRGKYIFRKMLERRLPQEIIEKKKQGFTPPDNTWYRNQLWDYLNHLLLSKDSRSHEFFEKDFIEKTLKSHLVGNDERFPLWSFIFFEVWCRKFLV